MSDEHTSGGEYKKPGITLLMRKIDWPWPLVVCGDTGIRIQGEASPIVVKGAAGTVPLVEPQDNE